MNDRQDARWRNRTRASAQAHRPGTDWFRVISYLVLGASLALFWWAVIVLVIALGGAA